MRIKVILAYRWVKLWFRKTTDRWFLQRMNTPPRFYSALPSGFSIGEGSFLWLSRYFLFQKDPESLSLNFYGLVKGFWNIDNAIEYARTIARMEAAIKNDRLAGG